MPEPRGGFAARPWGLGAAPPQPARGAHHFRWPVVLEVHLHVDGAGFLTAAHLVLVLPFPPARKTGAQSAPKCSERGAVRGPGDGLATPAGTQKRSDHNTQMERGSSEETATTVKTPRSPHTLVTTVTHDDRHRGDRSEWPCSEGRLTGGFRNRKKVLELNLQEENSRTRLQTRPEAEQGAQLWAGGRPDVPGSQGPGRRGSAQEDTRFPTGGPRERPHGARAGTHGWDEAACQAPGDHTRGDAGTGLRAAPRFPQPLSRAFHVPKGSQVPTRNARRHRVSLQGGTKSFSGTQSPGNVTALSRW